MSLNKSYYVDSFLKLKSDIQRSFIKIQQIYADSSSDKSELENLFKNITWSLEDLEKLNQLSQNNDDDQIDDQSQCRNVKIEEENTSLTFDGDVSNQSDDEGEDKTLLKRERSHRLTKKNRSSTIKQYDVFPYSKENSEPLLVKTTKDTSTTNFLSYNERIDYVKRMRAQLHYYKNEMIKQQEMEIVQLSPPPSPPPTALLRSQDEILKTQDEQFDNIHSTVISLKNLTQNINFELGGHVQVLNNLDQNMTHNQNNIQQLTVQTDYFIRNKSDPIVHTFLTAIAIILFFIIIILLVFF
ncbi:unnamed protein product [Didymodactylos carnosus]|uniref:t-SNARE coiled-coil homology domain-containing protein n=1 Tax=Didymodactylos carnosus TaxID=1234261 RepID=A0A8S2CK11_9BILA|nr:unnamed protein product [Didymodactylos carnosus]CAF3494453.1 unnamed protein product [Didymodactylos carnosus]